MHEPRGRVPRLFIERPLQPQATFELPEQAAHHAVRVLRLREGDALVLFDGRGGEYPAHLSLTGRDRVVARTGDRDGVERESPVSVTLVQAVSSSDKMDFTVQKAVELGVSAIHPVFSARSVVRPSGDREAKKLAHWRRIAIAACEQCGRNRIPDIHAPVALERYHPPEAASKILLAPAGTERLANLARSPAVLAAGPEAGFSDAEEAMLRSEGFAPVRLGPRVLRTETAALAALAVLNALTGDF